jgi:hypothetical protein
MNLKKILVILVLLSILAFGGYSIFLTDSEQQPIDSNTEDSDIFPSNITSSNSSLASISYRTDTIVIVSGDQQVDSIYIASEVTNESTGDTEILFERVSDSGFVSFTVQRDETYGVAVGVDGKIYRVSEVRARK